MPYDVSTFKYGRNGADAKIWIQRFIAKMIAAGWAKTSDTGQINPASISASATYTAHTNLGFAVFVLDDSYRATDPIYLRCEFWIYGVGYTGSVDYMCPQINATIGFATNGAGVITGQSLKIGMHAEGDGYQLNLRTCLDVFASGEGWATVAHGIGAGFFSSQLIVRQLCFFQLQRERDSSGNVIPGKVFVVYAEPGRKANTAGSAYSACMSTATIRSNNSSVRILGHHLFKSGGGTSAQVAAMPGIIGSASMCGSVNGVIQAQPTWMHLPQIKPATGVIAIPGAVLAAGAVFTASIDGVNEFKYASLGIGDDVSELSIGSAYAIDSFAWDTYCPAVRVQ